MRYVDGTKNATKRPGNTMANNATQHTGTRYAHNNGPGGRKMVSTSGKLRFRPDISHNCVPAKTTAL